MNVGRDLVLNTERNPMNQLKVYFHKALVHIYKRGTEVNFIKSQTVTTDRKQYKGVLE